MITSKTFWLFFNQKHAASGAKSNHELQQTDRRGEKQK